MTLYFYSMDGLTPKYSPLNSVQSPDKAGFSVNILSKQRRLTKLLCGGCKKHRLFNRLSSTLVLCYRRKKRRLTVSEMWPAICWTKVSDMWKATYLPTKSIRDVTSYLLTKNNERCGQLFATPKDMTMQLFVAPKKEVWPAICWPKESVPVHYYKNNFYTQNTAQYT